MAKQVASASFFTSFVAVVSGRSQGYSRSPLSRVRRLPQLPPLAGLKTLLELSPSWRSASADNCVMAPRIPRALLDPLFGRGRLLFGAPWPHPRVLHLQTHAFVMDRAENAGAVRVVRGPGAPGPVIRIKRSPNPSAVGGWTRKWPDRRGACQLDKGGRGAA